MKRSVRFIALSVVGMFTAPGCVERTITITSEPSGALVYLNDREIGRTPVDVNFVHYGDYDVRLVKDGYEPQLTHGDANAPLWDLPGPDFAAEILPVKLHSRITWHYVLEPAGNEPAGLVQRAQELRGRLGEAEQNSADSSAPVPAVEESAAPPPPAVSER